MGFYNKSVFLEFAEPFTGYPRTAFKLREIDLRVLLSFPAAHVL